VVSQPGAGPYTTASHMEHPPGGMPAAVPEAGLITHQCLAGAELVLVGQRVGGRVIHAPVVERMRSPMSGFTVGARFRTILSTSASFGVEPMLVS
jgi:hypothetical protein